MNDILYMIMNILKAIKNKFRNYMAIYVYPNIIPGIASGIIASIITIYLSQYIPVRQANPYVEIIKPLSGDKASGNIVINKKTKEGSISFKVVGKFKSLSETQHIWVFGRKIEDSEGRYYLLAEGKTSGLDTWNCLAELGYPTTPVDSEAILVAIIVNKDTHEMLNKMRRGEYSWANLRNNTKGVEAFHSVCADIRIP